MATKNTKKASIEPTLEELKAIEQETLEPLTNEDIKYIFENAEKDIDFDTFQPFDFSDFDDNF